MDSSISYPPTRDRPNPSEDGSDLLGRHFLDPELGVCYITLGPVLHKVISTRAERNQQNLPERNQQNLSTGAYYTLCYRQSLTDAEHISSITETSHWIKNGPILQPPTATGLDSIYNLPISVSSQATAMPPHNNPAAIIQQLETTQQNMSHDTEIPTGPTTSPVPDENEILAQIANEESIPIADTLISNNSSIEATRTSTRTKTK